MKIEICKDTKETIQWVTTTIGIVVILTQASSCAEHGFDQDAMTAKARYEAGIVNSYERKPRE